MPDQEQPKDFEQNVKRVVDNFHLVYYHGVLRKVPVWNETYWLGNHVFKCPFDLWNYQEIIFELRPEVIVETGVAMGGSLAYLSSVCALLGTGEIVGIDIEITEEARRVEQIFPNVKLLDGSSTDAAIVDEVRSIVGGRRALVILDSDHTMQHVLNEMKIYREFVPVGGYLIVEDSNVNEHPVYPDWGPGPHEAIEQFLKETDAFAIDRNREKFYLTFSPDGYLRRVK